MTTRAQVDALERQAKKRRKKKPAVVVVWPGETPPADLADDVTIVRVEYDDVA